MSLEQLQKQIEVATVAMEKAAKSGNKSTKARLKKELAKFQKVLEKSKQRFRELEMIKKQCDDLSARREAATPKHIVKPAKSDDDSGPIHIPWLKTNKQAAQERRDETESAEMAHLAAAFGGQVIASASDIASVSSLGRSEFTPVVEYSPSSISNFQKSLEEELQRLNSRLEESDRVFASKQKDARSLINIQKGDNEEIEIERPNSEERDDPQELTGTLTTSPIKNVLTAEEIAEQELKARERYIRATKRHLELQQAGAEPGSEVFKQSEKILRDCYAEIEYWECLGEEQGGQGKHDIHDIHDAEVLKGAFGRLDPKKKKQIDFDAEETKAREAYLSAMLNHQKVVNSGISTTSDKWKESLKQLEESLLAFQYWEGRREFVAPPTFVKSRPTKS